MRKGKVVTMGFDNGCTGTLAAFVDGRLVDFREQFSYRWRKPHVLTRNSYMSRIDFPRLVEWIASKKALAARCLAVVERPMTDETRLHQTLSSHHAQEALMIALEQSGVPYMTVDSSAWQRRYLPGISGSVLLKAASAERAAAEYPEFAEAVRAHGDADAVFIARTAVDAPESFVPDSERPPAEERKFKSRKFTTNFGGRNGKG